MKSTTKKLTVRLFVGLLCVALLVPVLALTAVAEDGARTVNDYWLIADDVNMKATKATVAPIIDGTVSTDEWKGAWTLELDPGSDEYKTFATKYNFASNKTWTEGDKLSFSFMWDENYLYILDKRIDSNPHYSAALVPGAATTVPWNTDGAIFGIQPLEALAPDAAGESYQFYTTLADESGNATGGVQLRTLVFGTQTKTYSEAPEGTEAAATLTNDGWQMEVAIPWSSISETFPTFSPTAGLMMGFKLYYGNKNGDSIYCTTYTNMAASMGFDKNGDYGGFPTLRLTEADGTFPADFDLTIPTSTAPTLPEGDIYDPGEATPEDTTAPETEAPAETSAPDALGDEQETEGGANVVGVVICCILAAGALGAGIFLIIKFDSLAIRLIAGISAAAILAGSVVGIVLFAKSAPEQEQESTTVDTSAGGGESTVASNVPDSVRFDGKEVVLLSRDGKEFEKEFNADMTGNIIENAVFERNARLEERLGIEFTVEPHDADTTKYLEKVRISTTSGDGAYDIISSYAYYGAALAIEGLYYDFNNDSEDNYINTDSPWYNRSFVNECTLNNKLYFTVGDLTISAYDRLMVTFVNQSEYEKYFESHKATELYDKAKNGEWTIDYLLELVKGVYRDENTVDGNGKDAGDFFGLTTNSGSMPVDGLISAFGISLIKKGDGDIPEIVENNQRSEGAYAKLLELIHTESNDIFVGNSADKTYYGTDVNYHTDQMFYDGKAMFAFGQLKSARTFAQKTELQYGILPLPKYDTLQKTYSSTPQDAYSIISIPFNIGADAAAATATVELLYQYSYEIVRPVYFESAYQERYASNETTAELFDMIIDDIYYNFGTVYSASLDDCLHDVRNGAIKNTKSLALIYRTAQKQWKAGIDDIVKKIVNT